MNKKKIRFGVIGCGLMGREFASAAARWCHLEDLDFQPEIAAVCDLDTQARAWFVDHIPSVRFETEDYREMLDHSEIDAVYCAVPHHLHEKFYIDVIQAGKHLLGEKPFGIDERANKKIIETIRDNPDVIVRCSSEFPFFPGAYRIFEWARDGSFGQIIDVEAGFLHSSDLNPEKPINWKRRIETNGEYGCMGDLGMHTLHLPLRLGWYPKNVRALLSNIIADRPDHEGNRVRCETWDNAILSCEVETKDQQFPLTLSMKRIAPGHANTWFIHINGTECSAKFSTENPKKLSALPYQPGKEQAWNVTDVSHQSAYRSITGNIFEFGFSDSILQMWASFCDELAHGSKMSQPLYCVTPEETAFSHKLFTAALESQRTCQTVSLQE